MLLAICLIFVAALAAPFFHKKGRLAVPIAAAFLTSGFFGYLLTFWGQVTSGNPFQATFRWAESLAINLSFYVDGLGLFFALLVSFFGVAILLFAGQYMKHYDQANRFFGYLILFMGAMLGLVLSANIITLFIFWELTSISSYWLIGFKHQKESSRESARQALLVTASGGLVLLAGLILLGIAGGSYHLPELLANAGQIRQHPYFEAIVVLVLIGAFTKSAQFPFHFWLPSAMEAPTPVSAFLHSATMVKAGVYLVFRMQPIFAGAALWENTLIAVGGFTAIMGAMVSLQADDLKRVLAFTTISALGLLFLAAGMGSETAMGAGMVFLLAHALYKGSLFMLAGALDHACGTRDISALREIPKRMPWTLTAMLLACLSMSGVIPFVGFLGKELLYKAALKGGILGYFPLFALVVSSLFFVAVSIKIIYHTFWPIFSKSQAKVKEAPLLMFAPPLAISALGLGFGVMGTATIQPLLEVAAGNMAGKPVPLDMSLWHGFNAVFLLSLGTLALGLGMYAAGKIYHWLYSNFPLPLAALPEKAYENGLHWLTTGATWLTKAIQNGYLRNYVSVYITFFSGLVLYYIFSNGLLNEAVLDWNLEGLQIYELLVLFLVSVTLFFIFKTNSRLAVIATIGITGYAIALGYLVFSAPDVAITQFLAETLGVILLAVILPKLPKLHVSDMAVKVKYVFASVFFGAIMAFITLVGMSHQNPSALKGFFLENSIPKGKGENAVNVILVDFRALDTLGEISVLVITMVGIVALMAKQQGKRESGKDA